MKLDRQGGEDHSKYWRALLGPKATDELIDDAHSYAEIEKDRRSQQNKRKKCQR